MTEHIEKRISELEHKLFGNASYENYCPQIFDTLVKLNTQMNAAATGQPNIENLFKRLDELEKCLAKDQSEFQPMTIENKLQMILPMKDELLKNVEDLKKIDLLCEVLGSEHLKVSPGLSSSLHKLSHIHLDQESQLPRISNETNKLLSQYNAISDLIMEELEQMNESVNIAKTKQILQ